MATPDWAPARQKGESNEAYKKRYYTAQRKYADKTDDMSTLESVQKKLANASKSMPTKTGFSAGSPADTVVRNIERAVPGQTREKRRPQRAPGESDAAYTRRTKGGTETVDPNADPEMVNKAALAGVGFNPVSAIRSGAAMAGKTLFPKAAEAVESAAPKLVQGAKDMLGMGAKQGKAAAPGMSAAQSAEMQARIAKNKATAAEAMEKFRSASNIKDPVLRANVQRALSGKRLSAQEQAQMVAANKARGAEAANARAGTAPTAKTAVNPEPSAARTAANKARMVAAAKGVKQFRSGSNIQDPVLRKNVKNALTPKVTKAPKAEKVAAPAVKKSAAPAAKTVKAAAKGKKKK
jgi:hypothetical protein